METMKRAAITGVRQAMLLDAPMPEPKGDLGSVKVHAVPLCTEYKNWLTERNMAGMRQRARLSKWHNPAKSRWATGAVVMLAHPVANVRSVLLVNISIARTGMIITNFRAWHMAATPMSSI